MLLAHTQFESKLWSQNIEYIAGIDEVGRGAWAGPMVIGAVIFPLNFHNVEPLADSKLLTEKKRNVLSGYIKSNAIAYCVVEAPIDNINELGIGKSGQIAFLEATKKLNVKPEHVLIDAFKIKNYPETKQTAIIKGDQQSISIAAASIIAKVYRDALMRDLHNSIPEYNFKKNVGYGTKEHRESIARIGLSDHHRKSFNLAKWTKNIIN
jgi:ribonuclease HII